MLRSTRRRVSAAEARRNGVRLEFNSSVQSMPARLGVSFELSDGACIDVFALACRTVCRA